VFDVYAEQLELWERQVAQLLQQRGADPQG
jgi:hypothetical protein